MIPMTNVARIFASRPNVKATIITVPSHVNHFKPALDICPYPIHLLTIKFQLPAHDKLVSSDLIPDRLFSDAYFEAIDSLEGPFGRLLDEHCPDCVVSSGNFPWSAALANARCIPRLVFYGSAAITSIVMRTISGLKLTEGRSDHEPFIVPGLPHPLEFTKAQIMSSASYPGDTLARMVKAHAQSYGTVGNSSYELEPGYASKLDKSYFIGPVALCTGDSTGEGGNRDSDEYLNWLDNQKKCSVLYVCFGSIAQFSNAQLFEIATGLEASGHPFLWVVRDTGNTAEWLPEGFVERVGRRGLLVRGWIAQMSVLNHTAIGGFMTHCGWGSVLEGVSAGLPMVTWPLFSDQFVNEKLIVDVLRIGVPVGSKVNSSREKERTFVAGEMVRKAVGEVLSEDGEEAEERRKRARKAAEMSRKAVEEGGSSYNDVSKLIHELREIKKSKATR
uniref:Glycosyltransferase n=1 Tax=Crocus sativus TaxID=82528 RepID=A0A139YZN7_CROSA|nr:UDP-glucose-dependent glucosyltransferase UGT703C1 [Crocus sativus]